MTDVSRGQAPVVSAEFRKRFLVALALIHALGGGFLYLALYFALSRPFEGDFSAVFAALRHHASFIIPVLTYAGAVYVFLVSLATTVLCVRALHKIAGPLYRMERVLDSYLAGEAVKPAFCRKGDQVTALAASFNGFIARFRDDRQTWLGKMSHAERLCFQDRATCRTEMGRVLEEMESLLAKYR